jgi:protocatechuate 3,4-dioxygenase beta subunit
MIAGELLQATARKTFEVVALTLLALVAIGGGAAYLAQSFVAAQQPPTPITGIPPADTPQPKATEPRPARPERMIVSGRVLDPDGNLMKNVPVDIVARLRKPLVATDDTGLRSVVLSQGITNPEGRFQIDAARTSGTQVYEVHAVAAAAGFGVGWAELNPDAIEPSADIRLRPEQVIHGKLVDIHGQPARRLELHVQNIGKISTVGRYEGVRLGLASEPPPEIRTWPASVVTDENGRFTLTGVGRDLQVHLIVRDFQFAYQYLLIYTDDQPGAKVWTQALQPVTTVEGRILAEDTEQPVPHAIVEAHSTQTSFLNGSGIRARAHADDAGRYVAHPMAGTNYRVKAVPPEGQPYLITQIEFPWVKGAVRRIVDIKLARGVLIRGKIVEQGTGRPLSGAGVQYLPAQRRDDLVHGWSAVTVSKDDGSFQIAVAPGKGYLFFHGATPDFLLKSIGARMISDGQPGGKRFYAHEIIAYDVKQGDSPHEINAALKPGKTVKGRIVGPQGQTVDIVDIVALLHLSYADVNSRLGGFMIHTRDGRFELHGLDSESPTRVSFLDADHQWGTTVELSGKQAGDDLTIQLELCGQAKARLIQADGKPVDHSFLPTFELLASPGRPDRDQAQARQSMFVADAVHVPSFDRRPYWQNLRSDANGRITLPNLVPGATYRITDNSNPKKAGQIRKDFAIKPGETLELGDILVERPKQ